MSQVGADRRATPVRPPRGAGRRLTGRLLVAAVAVLLVVTLVRLFVVDWYAVTSDSMAPTATTGDKVVVDLLGWRLGTLSRGDVVTFASPQDGSPLLKRIVAIAGDVVRIDDSVLVVNGISVPEPQVDHSRIDATYFGPVVVPDGFVFVMGDNRFGSVDSRVFGPVPLHAVTGRLVVTL